MKNVELRFSEGTKRTIIMATMYEEFEATRREYSDLDSEDFAEAESNARARMYDEVHGLQGAYHLWENGHVEGDASDVEIIADGKLFGLEIDVKSDDSKQTLFDKLDEEFLRRYREELEKLPTTQKKKACEEAIKDLGQCPLCGSEEIEARYGDDADLTGYCRSCGEYFECDPGEKQ